MAGDCDGRGERKWSGSQVRAKVSTFGGGFGGPTEVTSGGNALKFYASVCLNIKRVGLVTKGDDVSSCSYFFSYISPQMLHSVSSSLS